MSGSFTYVGTLGALGKSSVQVVTGTIFNINTDTNTPVTALQITAGPFDASHIIIPQDPVIPPSPFIPQEPCVGGWLKAIAIPSDPV